MNGLADQAVHQDEFAHGPADRFDRLLDNAVVVVQQGHVRYVARLHREPGPPDLLDQRPLKLTQGRQTVAATEDEWPIARSRVETQRAIEPDLERRRGDRRGSLPGRGDDIFRQAAVEAERMQRDVEPIGPQRLAAEAMPAAQLPCKGRDPFGDIRVRKDRKEQAVRSCRRRPEPVDASCSGTPARDTPLLPLDDQPPRKIQG